MHWPLNISQNGVLEHHGMAELQIAGFFNGGVMGCSSWQMREMRSTSTSQIKRTVNIR